MAGKSDVLKRRRAKKNQCPDNENHVSDPGALLGWEKYWSLFAGISGREAGSANKGIINKRIPKRVCHTLNILGFRGI